MLTRTVLQTHPHRTPCPQITIIIPLNDGAKITSTWDDDSQTLKIRWWDQIISTIDTVTSWDELSRRLRSKRLAQGDE